MTKGLPPAVVTAIVVVVIMTIIAAFLHPIQAHAASGAIARLGSPHVVMHGTGIEIISMRGMIVPSGMIMIVVIIPSGFHGKHAGGEHERKQKGHAQGEGKSCVFESCTKQSLHQFSPFIAKLVIGWG